MLYAAMLLILAAGLFGWFIIMAMMLTGPIGALVAFWGPVIVGLLIYKEVTSPYR